MTLKVCFAKSSDFIQLRLLLLLLRFPDHQACHLLWIPLHHTLLVYMEFLSRLTFPEEALLPCSHKGHLQAFPVYKESQNQQDSRHISQHTHLHNPRIHLLLLQYYWLRHMR